jgi:hypothetical protein
MVGEKMSVRRKKRKECMAGIVFCVRIQRLNSDGKERIEEIIEGVMKY